PRIAMLEDLISKHSDNSGDNRDDVRLAAAIALFQVARGGANSAFVDAAGSALRTSAQIASESAIPGVARDAQRFMGALGPRYWDYLSETYQDQIERETARYKREPSKEHALQLADSTSARALILAKQGKDAAATTQYMQALNLYCQFNPPKSADELTKLKPAELSTALKQFETDPSQHMRQVSDCAIALGELLTANNKAGSTTFDLGKQLGESGHEMQQSCLTHTTSERWNERLRYAEWKAKMGDAFESNSTCNWMLNEMRGGGASNAMQIRCLEQLAQTEMQGGEGRIIASGMTDDDWKARDGVNASKYLIYMRDLKISSGYPLESIAADTNRLVEAYERVARYSPDQRAQALKLANEQLNQILPHLQNPENKVPQQVVAHELKFMSDFYQRNGDPAKALEFRQKALDSYRSVVSSGSIDFS
ncbi:MAG: hypothetical protein ACRD3W_24135, partial [Terriglobales bacterium]